MKIVKGYEIEQPKGVSILIYGEPGIGKSTLSISAKNPIYFDLERGFYRVQAKNRNCAVVQPDTYKDIDLFINSKEINQFDSIIFDTISEMLVYMEKQIQNESPKSTSGGKLNQYGYGLRATEFRNLVTKIRSLNKNIIFIAHTDEIQKDTGKIYKNPSISGKPLAALTNFIDLIGYMEAAGSTRTISFIPSDEHKSKNSLGLNKIFNIPILNENNLENNFLQILIEQELKRREEQAEILKRFEEIIEIGKQIINSNLDDPNISLDLLSKLEKVETSKKHLWIMLEKKAKENGWNYDGKSKQFILNS